MSSHEVPAEFTSSSYTPKFTYYTIKANSLYLHLSIFLEDRQNIALDFKTVDQKMDDGIYSGGTIRAYCYGSSEISGGTSSYDDAINDKCNTRQYSDIWYNMGL